MSMTWEQRTGFCRLVHDNATRNIAEVENSREYNAALQGMSEDMGAHHLARCSTPRDVVTGKSLWTLMHEAGEMKRSFPSGWSRWPRAITG